MKLRSILRKAVFATAAIGMAALVSCGQNKAFNINNLLNRGDSRTDALLSAAGHEANALALSEKDEDAIGQSVGVVLTDKFGVYQNDKVETYVTLVGLTVASASPNPAGNYVFGVLDTPEVNAFSGPNGYIFVTRGLLAQIRDEAELAGVLGHEIGHVCNHDGLHQLQAAEQQGALSEAVQAGAGNQQFSALADFGVDIITKTGYTQPQEFQADQDGVKFMTAAGYDPHSYLRFLERLQKLETSGSAGKIMSTHPGVRDRVKRVADEIKQMKASGGAKLADRFARNVPNEHP